jgi:hypothetical protein
MKYRVRSEEKFEVNDVEISDGDEHQKLRPKITWFLLWLCALFIGASAVYGAITHDFSGLSSVWSEARWMIGIVIGYYFGKFSSDRTSK